MSMPIEATVRTYLAGKSTTAGTRFFYDTVPQGTEMPYGYIQVISTTKPYTYTGAGKKRYRVQVSNFGDTHFAAKTLAQEVEGHMENLTGCQKAFFENETVLPEESARHIPQDYFIWE